MKKVLALILAIVLVLSLAACGGGGSSNSNGGEDTTSNNTNTIVGKWKLSSTDYSIVQSHLNKCNPPLSIKEGEDIIEFFEDGSCNVIMFVCYSYDGGQYSSSNNYASYSINQNGKIHFDWDREVNIPYKISDNKLVFSFEDADYDTLTYERIE